MSSLPSGDLVPASLVTKRVDEWLLSGSWGGGHLGAPTLLRSVPFLLPIDVSQGDVHGLPTK